MLWAGPIEFSTGEVILILLALVGIVLALPAAAGLVAVILYRRKTLPEARSRRDMVVLFFKTLALALLILVVGATLIGFLQNLIG